MLRMKGIKDGKKVIFNGVLLGAKGIDRRLKQDSVKDKKDLLGVKLENE